MTLLKLYIWMIFVTFLHCDIVNDTYVMIFVDFCYIVTLLMYNTSLILLLCDIVNVSYLDDYSHFITL